MPLVNGHGLEDEADESTSRWRVIDRHFFMQNNAKITCATFHSSSGLLVVGFSNGLFGLYELPDFNMLHTLRSAPNPACSTMLHL